MIRHDAFTHDKRQPIEYNWTNSFIVLFVFFCHTNFSVCSTIFTISFAIDKMSVFFGLEHFYTEVRACHTAYMPILSIQ